jgi:hypothetical protein
MYQASSPNSSSEVQLWISTFDFVGFVLFFHAIFTVVHALSIIIWSMLTSTEYHRYHSISIADVSSEIETLKENPFYHFLYHLNYYPFLTSRQKAEFKVIHVLFRNTFGVPLDFNFGEYLGKCFERYSLNIIKLSVTSWIIMFILYGLNLIRIFSPTSNAFDCDPRQNDHDDGGSTPAEHTLWNVRTLKGEDDDLNLSVKSSCDLAYVRMFTLCSVMLECYVVIIFLIGRVYTLRLLKKAGITEISDNEDNLLYFLDEEAAQEHITSHITELSPVNEHSTTSATPSRRRMSTKTFSKFIRKSPSLAPSLLISAL